MENRAKSLFYSVLFNKFHHRTNLMALLVTRYIEVRKTEKILKILKLDILRVPPIQIPPKLKTLSFVK
jgi:hypothetical protein